jgi:hypothetical protein
VLPFGSKSRSISRCKQSSRALISAKLIMGSVWFRSADESVLQDAHRAAIPNSDRVRIIFRTPQLARYITDCVPGGGLVARSITVAAMTVASNAAAAGWALRADVELFQPFTRLLPSRRSRTEASVISTRLHYDGDLIARC